MKAFSKVHYTHLVLSNQASSSLTNDPNRAKSVVELSRLSSEIFWLQNLVWISATKKKKNKNNLLTIIQTWADAWPYNNFTSILFLVFVFCLPWEVYESLLFVFAPTLPQKATWPSAWGCLLTARFSERKPCAHLERCITDPETFCTEQMGPAWDEEIILMPCL